MSRAWPGLARRLNRDLWQRPARNFHHLDGMRALASVMVTCYHCALFIGVFSSMRYAGVQSPLAAWRPILNGLWCGIDIFFVLSGFLIGRILFLQVAHHGKINFKQFFLRRFFRIFPAYYFIVTLSLLIVAPLSFTLWPLLFGTTDWTRLLHTVWANLFYVNNYVLAGHQANVLSWGWSLCVEEHFYLLLPLLLTVLFTKPLVRYRLAVLIACVLLPLAGRWIQYRLDPHLVITDGFYYFSHNRFDEIFIGVITAYLYVFHFQLLKAAVKRFQSWIWMLAVGCFGMVWAYGGLYGTGAMTVVWQFSLLPIGSALLVVNGLFATNRCYRFFAHPLWYPLSRISYGAYLIHPFVLFGCLEIYLGLTGTTLMPMHIFGLLFLTVFILSSVLAALMFSLLERPLLDYGIRLNRRASNPRQPAFTG